MELTTSGEIDRLDLGPVASVLPALRDEWAALRFDADGSVVNPLTGEPMSQLVLAEGAHRRAGAVYRVAYRMPVTELPEELREGFDQEAEELARTGADGDAWDEHLRRVSDASVVVGRRDVRASVVLRHDDARRLASTVREDGERGTIEFDIQHARLPVVALTGKIDLAALLSAEDVGPMRRFLGDTATWQATIDLTALERSGRVVEAAAEVKRFAARAQLSVRSTGSRWEVTGDAVLSGRRLGRVVLFLARKHIRAAVEAALDDAWDASGDVVDDVAEELDALGVGIDTEGGAGPFVRRLLWDPDFDGSVAAPPT